ncbi:MAG: type II toxin-antitoxin system VapC family toxin [Bryobacterales bacterium]|nr:type II toxin-antitoxin system VapC family toxin [Bryobacterales bacterium]
MIILDTNVLSEILKPIPDSAVSQRMFSVSRLQMHTTAIGMAEILLGMDLMPLGRKRNLLVPKVTELFSEEFAGKMLPFDREAAGVYAEIVAFRRRSGRPITVFDAQIAAIARRHAAILCTRNIKDFVGCEISLWNPWEQDCPSA